METKEIKCVTCRAESVVIENKLFFSEEKKIATIICPSCNNKVAEEYTDGWFFIQTKEQYVFQIEIDQQKEQIKFDSSM